MAPFRGDNWIRIFDVGDPKRHKKGFTVYQITSLVYPKQFPEAVTKVVVWKRFNDVKKLFNELRVRHQKLHLPGTFPVLAKCSYFKRFEKSVIEERRQCILNLLEFIAQQPPLFTSTAFVKFFQSGYGIDDNGDYNQSEEDLLPPPLVPQNVNQIPSPVEPISIFESPEAHSYQEDISQGSEDPSTFGDEDSESGAASLPLENDDMVIFDPLHGVKDNGDIRRNSLLDEVDNAICVQSIQDITLLSQVATPDDTSKILDQINCNSSEDSNTTHVLPQDNTSGNGFDLSFASYQTILTGLLKEIHGSDFDEKDEEVTGSYSPLIIQKEVYGDNLDETIKFSVESQLKCPVTELLRYRVLGVVDKTLLVLDTEDGACYIMKVLRINEVLLYFSGPHTAEVLSILHKCSAPRPKQTIVPHNVPFMVPLYRYYETDNAVFLILKHASGGKLWDHIRSYFRSLPTTPVHPITKYKREFPLKLSVKCNGASNSAENSYQKMIDEYRTMSTTDNSTYSLQKVSEENFTDNNFKSVLCDVTEDLKEMCDDETSLEVDVNNVKEHIIPDLRNFSVSACGLAPDLLPQNLNKPLETTELLVKSQELLASVSQTLKKSETVTRNVLIPSESSSKKISENKETVSNKDYTSSQVEADVFVFERSRRRYRRRCSSEQYDGFDGFTRTRSGSLDRCATFPETTTKLPEATVKMWASELLVVLDALHNWGIICKDLRPDNILLGDGGHILLTYHSQWASVDKLHCTYRPYMAPELSEVFPATPSVDWWSYGVLLFELLTGKKPLVVGGILDIPDFISTEAQSLLAELLKQDPLERLGSNSRGIEDIKQHPFFSGIDWQALLEVDTLNF